MLSYTTTGVVSYVHQSGDTEISDVGVSVRLPEHIATRLGVGLGSRVEVRISPKEE